MGFDDGECYICYANGGGNDPYDRGYICFRCFGNKIEEIEKPYTPPRWVNGLSYAINTYYLPTNEVCGLCKRKCKILMYLSLCKTHGGGELVDSSDDDEEE